MKRSQLSLPVLAFALAILPLASRAEDPKSELAAAAELAASDDVLEFEVAEDIAEFGFSEFPATRPPVAATEASPSRAKSAPAQGTKAPRVTGDLGVKDTTDSVPICVDLPWGTTLCCTPKSCVVF
ncbi:MAG TPA: hypothetical protein VJU61_20110 [Polyangiaceae bacterium]|nr:hypothetical protein [Polyangiaceae bacterium]